METTDLKPGKVLAIISDSADLHTAVTSLEGAIDRKKEKLEFIKKQVESIFKTFEEESHPWWREIESILKAKGKLPENYNHKESVGLEFSREGDCIRVAAPTPSLIDLIMRGMS